MTNILPTVNSRPETSKRLTINIKPAKKTKRQTSKILNIPVFNKSLKILLCLILHFILPFSTANQLRYHDAKQFMIYGTDSNGTETYLYLDMIEFREDKGKLIAIESTMDTLLNFRQIIGHPGVIPPFDLSVKRLLTPKSLISSTFMASETHLTGYEWFRQTNNVIVNCNTTSCFVRFHERVAATRILNSAVYHDYVTWLRTHDTYPKDVCEWCGQTYNMDFDKRFQVLLKTFKSNMSENDYREVFLKYGLEYGIWFSGRNVELRVKK